MLTTTPATFNDVSLFVLFTTQSLPQFGNKEGQINSQHQGCPIWSSSAVGRPAVYRVVLQARRQTAAQTGCHCPAHRAWRQKSRNTEQTQTVTDTQRCEMQKQRHTETQVAAETGWLVTLTACPALGRNTARDTFSVLCFRYRGECCQALPFSEYLRQFPTKPLQMLQGCPGMQTLSSRPCTWQRQDCIKKFLMEGMQLEIVRSIIRLQIVGNTIMNTGKICGF